MHSSLTIRYHGQVDLTKCYYPMQDWFNDKFYCLWHEDVQ